MRLFEVGQQYKTSGYSADAREFKVIVTCTSITDYMVTFRDNSDNLYIGKLFKDYDNGECLALLPDIFAKDIPSISTTDCLEDCQLSLF